MKLHLDGKLALVTGSTMGIGKAIAVSLLQEGAHVIINGRSETTVNATVEELQTLGTVYGIVADLGTQLGCDRLIAEVEKIGVVDLLINNVGKFNITPFEQTTDEDW